MRLYKEYSELAQKLCEAAEIVSEAETDGIEELAAQTVLMNRKADRYEVPVEFKLEAEKGRIRAGIVNKADGTMLMYEWITADSNAIANLIEKIDELEIKLFNNAA